MGTLTSDEIDLIMDGLESLNTNVDHKYGMEQMIASSLLASGKEEEGNALKRESHRGARERKAEIIRLKAKLLDLQDDIVHDDQQLLGRALDDLIGPDVAQG